MTYDSTSYTRNIPAQKRHPRLLQRIVAFLRLPQSLIDLIHRRLECRKLHHCVRYLPPPQRIQSLIQSSNPLFRRHLCPSFPQGVRIRRQRRLHSDFHSFKRAQCEIGKEFSRGGSTEVDNCFVGIGEELFAVVVFEDFVETVFTGALEGVANCCGRPTEEDATEALLGEDAAPGGEVGGVDTGVDLPAAFYLEVYADLAKAVDLWARLKGKKRAGQRTRSRGVTAIARSVWGQLQRESYARR